MRGKLACARAPFATIEAWLRASAAGAGASTGVTAGLPRESTAAVSAPDDGSP